MKRFTLANIKKERCAPGQYKLYDKNRKVLYDGASKNVRNRLQACLYRRSDYAQVKKKDELCKKTYYFSVIYTSAREAFRRDRCTKSKYSKY